jgi:hypothetical protein
MSSAPAGDVHRTASKEMMTTAGRPAGHSTGMFLAFLSRRLRAWLLFAVALPLGGRLLEALGVRVAGRNPRAGEALTRAGGYARRPRQSLRRRR